MFCIVLVSVIFIVAHAIAINYSLRSRAHLQLLVLKKNQSMRFMQPCLTTMYIIDMKIM